MGGPDQGLPEPPGRDERCTMVLPEWDHKGELLLPAPACKKILPGGSSGGNDPQPVVPVPAGLLDGRKETADAPGQGLDISMKDFSIHVTIGAQQDKRTIDSEVILAAANDQTLT